MVKSSKSKKPDQGDEKPGNVVEIQKARGLRSEHEEAMARAEEYERPVKEARARFDAAAKARGQRLPTTDDLAMLWEAYRRAGEDEAAQSSGPSTYSYMVRSFGRSAKGICVGLLMRRVVSNPMGYRFVGPMADAFAEARDARPASAKSSSTHFAIRNHRVSEMPRLRMSLPQRCFLSGTIGGFRRRLWMFAKRFGAKIRITIA